MKSFLVSAALGLLSLALVNLCAPYTGLSLPVSPISLGTSALLGAPGTALLLVLNGIL